MGHPLRNGVKRCYVIDGRGNVGVTTTYFIGGGTPNAHIGVNYNQTEGNSIYDLEGVAWDVGGGSTRRLGLGAYIQDGDWNGSISKSLFPYEMHGGVALTTVTSATDLLYIQDDMAKYGGGMYQ